MRVAPLDRSQLPAATALLARACPFDRAGDVADEKLFGVAPQIVELREVGTLVPQPLGAWLDDALDPTALPFKSASRCGGAALDPTALPFGSASRCACAALDPTALPFGSASRDARAALVGVACVAGNRLRLLAVDPSARGQGVGSALLAACEAAGGVRALDQPGNYLAPGIDERNAETIAWLERRGWQRAGEPRVNVLLDVRDNPRVSAARVEALTAAATARGYEIRRARADERALLAAVAAEFGGAWPFELARALAFATPGVHVALRDGAYCGFAAHDGNNAGLGWFGPTGTWPAHRGQGLGEALLLACLVDVARDHARCEVAWIGPRPFYDKVAGIAAERRFIAMSRAR